MLGQGITPRQHHPLARGLADADMRRLFDGIRQPIDSLVATMPSHQQFIEQYCKADSSVWAGRRN
jgi:tryptophan halogenase